MNPILQQLMGSNPQMQNIRNLMNMVKSSGNPQAMLNQLSQNNPQLQQVMATIQQYGNDPQKAFYALAQQRGIDPQSILETLK